jgi:hypothetical protein
MPRKKKEPIVEIDYKKISFTYIEIIKNLITERINYQSVRGKIKCTLDYGHEKIELELGPEAKIHDVIGVMFNMIVSHENTSQAMKEIMKK